SRIESRQGTPPGGSGDRLKGRLMNRRLLTAAFGAALIVAAAIPVTTSARAPQTGQRATRVPLGSIDVRLHPGMLADTVGDVMIELTGTPVVVRQAKAR